MSLDCNHASFGGDNASRKLSERFPSVSPGVAPPEAVWTGFQTHRFRHEIGLVCTLAAERLLRGHVVASFAGDACERRRHVVERRFGQAGVEPVRLSHFVNDPNDPSSLRQLDTLAHRPAHRICVVIIKERRRETCVSCRSSESRVGALGEHQPAAKLDEPLRLICGVRPAHRCQERI